MSTPNTDLNPLLKKGLKCFWAFYAVWLIYLSTTLGIWEPWEASAAEIVRNMLVSGDVFSVNVGTLENPQLLNQLPFAWWPTILSVSLLGESELALRIPNLFMFGLVIWSLHRLSLRLYGERIAALNTTIALAVPSLYFQSLFSLGVLIPAGFIALTNFGLAIIILRGNSTPLERRLVWAMLVCAALTGGLVGLALPLIFGAAISKSGHSIRETLRRDKLELLIATLTILVAIAMAGLQRTEGLPIIQWLWFIDGLSIERTIALRPAFSLYVHQIGFGLFPWGALAPLAFAIVSLPRIFKGVTARIHIGMFVWFAGAFVYGAICYSWTHYAIFLGAPALAFVLGPFFQTLLADHRRYGFIVLIAVVTVALLDSNLKHDPRLLAETFVGAKIDIFPAEVWYARWGRVINASLLGICLFGGTQLVPWSRNLLHQLLFPKTSPYRSNVPLILVSLTAGGVITALLERPLLNWVNRFTSPQLMNWVKVALLGLLISAIMYTLIFQAWRWRSLAKESGLLKSLLCGIDWLEKNRGHLTFNSVIFVPICWSLLNMGAIAPLMTDNFSQKALLNEYEKHRSTLNDAPIFTYELSERDRSYYARDLDTMDLRTFREFCQNDKPFFAVIPQKNLAQVNENFRSARNPGSSQRGNHIPVLYDGGARFYLISNRLPEGAEDLNPMKRAFVPNESDLPADVNRVDIDFEGKVKIIGWRVEPKIARLGAPMKVTIYWQVLTNRIGSWKVFIHMDAPGQRIHGDHDPVAGLVPTTNWRAGDIIADEHTINVSRTKSPANFTFYTGLFRGDKRLKVTAGPQDGKDRAKLGIVRVK